MKVELTEIETPNSSLGQTLCMMSVECNVRHFTFLFDALHGSDSRLNNVPDKAMITKRRLTVCLDNANRFRPSSYFLLDDLGVSVV